LCCISTCLPYCVVNIFPPACCVLFLYLISICLMRRVLVLQHQLSNDKQVTLKNVNLKSSGTYRCEVSAERPNFSSAGGEGRMEVVCKWQHLYFYTYICMYVSQSNLKLR
jgi:hypothetical protein